jgi:hypothetical protein
MPPTTITQLSLPSPRTHPTPSFYPSVYTRLLTIVCVDGWFGVLQHYYSAFVPPSMMMDQCRILFYKVNRTETTEYFIVILPDYSSINNFMYFPTYYRCMTKSYFLRFQHDYWPPPYTVIFFCKHCWATDASVATSASRCFSLFSVDFYRIFMLQIELNRRW